jgi:transaldolase
VKGIGVGHGARIPFHIAREEVYVFSTSAGPFKVLEQSMKHPLTDSGIERFLADWQNRQ